MVFVIFDVVLVFEIVNVIGFGDKFIFGCVKGVGFKFVICIVIEFKDKVLFVGCSFGLGLFVYVFVLSVLIEMFVVFNDEVVVREGVVFVFFNLGYVEMVVW